jgi:hypothetical protein
VAKIRHLRFGLQGNENAQEISCALFFMFRHIFAAVLPRQGFY